MPSSKFTWKPQTPSWDNRSAFRLSPYSKAPTSTISTSTSSLSALTSGGNRCRAMSPETPQTSFKGKGTLAQIKAGLEERLDGLNESSIEQRYKLAMLKNECKSLRAQAYMRDKEIAHLEAENAKDCAEAEKIHSRELEKKKMDIEFLREESEVLRLKVELVKLQSGGGTPSA